MSESFRGIFEEEEVPRRYSHGEKQPKMTEKGGEDSNIKFQEKNLDLLTSKIASQQIAEQANRYRRVLEGYKTTWGFFPFITFISLLSTHLIAHRKKI